MGVKEIETVISDVNSKLTEITDETGLEVYCKVDRVKAGLKVAVDYAEGYTGKNRTLIETLNLLSDAVELLEVKYNALLDDIIEINKQIETVM